MDKKLETVEITEEIMPPIKNLALASPWRCQVDASWTETSDGIGMGFVLLKLDKKVIAGQCKSTQTSSPLQAEAESMCRAMKEVKDRGLQHVIYESDCQ